MWNGVIIIKFCERSIEKNIFVTKCAPPPPITLGDGVSIKYIEGYAYK